MKLQSKNTFLHKKLIIPGVNQNLTQKSTKVDSQALSSPSLSLKKRSVDYIRFISKIENLEGHSVNGYKELIDKISVEIGPLGLPTSPIGILAKCFLGAPFDVHILGLSGDIIINHYKVSEQLPPDYAKARILAIHNQYSIVEVYNDKFVLIDIEGNTTNLTK